MPCDGIAVRTCDASVSSSQRAACFGAAAAVVTPIVKVVTLLSSLGSGPTISTPGTSICSHNCWIASSASPARDEFGDRAAVAELAFGNHRVGNAEALQELHEMHAAGRAGRRIDVGHRLCGEQRVAEIVAVGDVRLRRTGAHRDAD